MRVQQCNDENKIKNDRQVSVEDTIMEGTLALDAIWCVTKFPDKFEYTCLLTDPL